MPAVFPHLNILSDYSFFQSGGTPSQFAAAGADGGANVLGIADIQSLSGVPEFAQASKALGFRTAPAVVLPVYVGKVVIPVRFHALGPAGWSSLCRMQAAALVDGCLSAEVLTEIAVEVTAVAKDPAQVFWDHSPNYSVDSLNFALTVLAQAIAGLLVEDLRYPGMTSKSTFLQLPIIATLPKIAAAPVSYPTPGDRNAWRLMSAIRAGITNFGDFYSPPQAGCHLLDDSTMAELFHDANDALARARGLADAVGGMPSPGPPRLPRLRDRDAATEIRLAAADGLAHLVGSNVPGPYRDRLAFELDVLIGMGFADYFMIVAEFVGFAKSRGISVGPGRGSGAGSLVAWSLGITGVDPLKHGLLFERFINPDRVSLPDFDIDICVLRRDEVIAHVRELYGDSVVARIATFAEIRGRGAIKDAARVLGIHFSDATEISSRIPPDCGDLRTALAEPGFKTFCEEHPARRRLIEHALGIEGLRRQSSIHAGGVIIAPSDLAHDTPLWRDQRSGQIVCGFDMGAAEKSGLVKFDFLGLSTLSIINEANRLLEGKGLSPPPGAESINREDNLVYEMLSAGRAVGVFQFDAMGQALRTVKPARFEDLVALNALYRPGPIAYIRTYAERKRDVERVGSHQYPVPAPELLTRPILDETFGIMVYQEQVMKIAQVCAGYSLGQADLLRRAISKKIAEELSSHRQGFIEGCQRTTQISAETAGRLFDDIERFANYGFNKSHAVAYALLGYTTAYLKAHHPAAWFAANMSFEQDRDRRAFLAHEARSMGVVVLPPSINRSGVSFDIEQVGNIWCLRHSLGHINGIGETLRASLATVLKRRDEKPFSSIPDFLERGGGALLPKAGLRALSTAGAFDDFGLPRSAVVEYFDLFVDVLKASSGGNRSAVGDDLFSSAPHPTSFSSSRQPMYGADLDGWFTDALTRLSPRLQVSYQSRRAGIPRQEWPDRLIREVAAIGFAVGTDPLDDLTEYLNNTGVSLQDQSTRFNGTPETAINSFYDLINDAEESGASLPTLRALSCVRLTGCRLIEPGSSSGGEHRPSTLLLDYKENGRSFSLKMSRDWPFTMSTRDVAEASLASGQPVVVDLELTVGRDGEGRRRVDTRVVALHALSDVIFTPPPGSLVITIEPTAVMSPEILGYVEPVALHSSESHTNGTRSIIAQTLVTMGKEVADALRAVHGQRMRHAVLDSGQPFDREPSFVVLKCAGRQLLLEGQYQLHPVMSPILKGLAGVSKVTRRRGPQKSAVARSMDGQIAGASPEHVMVDIQVDGPEMSID